MFMTWVNHTGSNSYDLDWRRDLQRIDSDLLDTTFTSNDRFYSYVQQNSYDYQPKSGDITSYYKVIGAGVLIDQTFFKDLNLLAGFRYDYIDAHAYQPAGIYERGSATPATDIYANTGLFNPNSYSSQGNSSKPSMSASLSYNAFGVHPYFTVGQQALIINSASDGGLNNITATKNNLTGTATLVEAGIKGSFFKDKLFFGLAAYDQTRSSYDVTAGGGAGAVSSTVSRGFEVEVRFLLTKNLSLSANGNWSKSELLASPGVILLSAREAGYPDVVDANGKVVIPAEAFGWGGRLQTNVPTGVSEFNEIPGQPNHIVSSTLSYNFTEGKLKGFFVSATALDQGSYWVGVLHTAKVPEAWVFDASMGYRKKKWEAYLIFNNLLNRSVYASGIGSPIGWVRPSFPQAVELNVVRRF
jgi:hypothetical protein